MLNFVDIDIETANPSLSSICQIGVADFVNGEIVREWKQLINPEESFDQINMRIHGIGPTAVENMPKFPLAASELSKLLGEKLIVGHSHFDRTSLLQACIKHNITPFSNQWLDTAKISRRTWKECASSGYGLSQVCKLIGYDFDHHDALEDAKAAGQILLAAINTSGVSAEEWIQKSKKPLGWDSSSKSIAKDGNP